uniref:Arrestin-like N-terminal domain-containing protein n=1 Tax=Romanomermis culicivorax TaxID=13658 RepID=A0A915JZX5_ROMCU
MFLRIVYLALFFIFKFHNIELHLDHMTNKLESFDVSLDSKNGVYFAGQTVAGRLIVAVPQAVKLCALTVVLHGEAKTSWINKTSDNIYDTSEPHVNDVLSLMDYLSTVSDGELLPTGRHAVPFKFRLASNLPSSIEGWFVYGIF